MSQSLLRISALEQARAVKLVEILNELSTALQAAGYGSRGKIVKRLVAQYNGSEIVASNGEKGRLRLAARTLYRMAAKFEKAPRASELVRSWSAPARAIPNDLIAEIRRRATAEGEPTNSVAINAIINDWKDGKEVPGVGTWQEWWVANNPGVTVPDRAPKFPWHPNSLYVYLPKRNSALSAAGRLGLAAAREFMMSVERDSSLLKPGEVYVCDDVRLDIVCHCALTGKLTEVRAYIMMDWGTRRIVAYTLRAGNALIEADVRALILRGLQAGGIRPVGEITHIFLERGTVALSDDAVTLLGVLTENRVEVHRTGMISGTRWAGAGSDKPVGNFRGKAVIESFMRRLHIMLGSLPGQRGNRYEAQPRNLDFEGQHRKRRPDSLADYSEALAALELDTNGRLRLELPYLWEAQVDEALAVAIKDYNSTRDHGMQGFHTVTVAEAPTGELIDVPGQTN